jgi:hypothetical protein
MQRANARATMTSLVLLTSSAIQQSAFKTFGQSSVRWAKIDKF